MMPYTFLLALLACLSLQRLDASPRTHHPQTEHKQQHAHASCLVVSHANRVAEKGFAPRRKVRSCDGAKHAAGLQACMSASFSRSGLMCGMRAFCSLHQHTRVIALVFFSAIVCLCDSPSVSSLFFLSHSLILNFPSSLTVFHCVSIYILPFSVSPPLPFSFSIQVFSRRSRLLIPLYLLNAHLLFQISFILSRYIWI